MSDSGRRLENRFRGVKKKSMGCIVEDGSHLSCSMSLINDETSGTNGLPS